MSFHIAGLLFGAGLIGLAVAAWWAPTRWPQLWRAVPRERIIGGAIGLLCLVWSAILVRPMMEGSFATYQPAIVPVAIVIGVAGAITMDYVFTRALGGLLVLSANWLLHAAFVAQAPARGAFSVVCYIIGLLGIFIIAYPYRFRDLLEALSLQSRWRHTVGALLLVAGLLATSIAWATHG